MTGHNVLISSAGRRVGLLECFRDSIAARGSDAKIYTIDAGSTAPASFLADGTFKVPLCTDISFIDAVLKICSAREVGLIIPTIDTELEVYATSSSRFSEIGVKVCISSPSTVRICCDKIATHQWLEANGFPTVRQTDLDTALEYPDEWQLPLIVKPVRGSASIGVRKVETLLELEAMKKGNRDFIVQEIASGREFTINVYVNVQGECVCTLPHLRMETRAGEVSKGITVKDKRLMDLAQAISSALPGAFGPLNIQCFVNDTGAIKIIEMNARFGGGYPLAHRAGARFTDWMLDEKDGRAIPHFENWDDDLAMLRYDEAIFIPGDKLRT